MKESFVGVEQRKSAAASPTKRIVQNLIFKLELGKKTAVGETIASKLILNTHRPGKMEILSVG